MVTRSDRAEWHYRRWFDRSRDQRASVIRMARVPTSRRTDANGAYAVTGTATVLIQVHGYTESASNFTIGGDMKSSTLKCITAMMLFAGLAGSPWLCRPEWYPS